MLGGVGRDSKGQPRGRSRRRKHRSEQRERGAQRAYCGLAAGASEVFVVDLPAIIYKRVAGTLAVFAADPQSTIY